MSCSSCVFLKENDKKEGAVSGCCYYCSKNKCYVNGANSKCERFERSYRSNYLCNKIFEDGEKYYDDTTDMGVYIILLILLIVFAIIVNIFN